MEEPPAFLPSDSTPASPSIVQSDKGRPAKFRRLDAPVLSAAPNISRNHAKRRHKRDSLFRQQGHAPRLDIAQQIVTRAPPVLTQLVTEKLPSAKGAYVGKNGNPKGATKKYSVADLVEEGFELIEWDGLSVPFPSGAFAC